MHPGTQHPGPSADAGLWQVERRSDGAVVVRVPSRGEQGYRPPDAVFAFRAGDPQYNYWEERLREQEQPAAHREAESASGSD